MCVCIQVSESIRSEYIREERHSREKEIFAVSPLLSYRAHSLSLFRVSGHRRSRPSVTSSRARPDECKSSTTALWTTFVVRLIIPAFPVRARPSCNPCQLVPPPRPIRPPPPREADAGSIFTRDL